MTMNETDYRRLFIDQGKHVGDYERIYQTADDPWDHVSLHHEFWSDRAMAIAWCQKLMVLNGVRRVVEFGSGLGHVVDRMTRLGLTATGVEIAPTAVKKAREKFPTSHFVQGDIKDLSLLHLLAPEVIFLSNITWSCLDELPSLKEGFMEYANSVEHPVYVIHIISLYPPGVQEYGRDFFTTHSEVLGYFGFDYLESASLNTWRNPSDEEPIFTSAFLAILNAR